MKRKMIFVVGVLVAIAAVAVPAFAQTARGNGTLTAEGNGQAQVRCTTCDITISGNGVLAILDTGETLAIDINGVGTREIRETEWGTAYIYRGFNGTATISGEYLGVGLRGADILLDAEGTGRVWLRGSGTYTTNGVSGEWAEDGAVVDIEAVTDDASE
ncbi:MAG: hypothetical protein AAF125_12905 [Chloroflexota bacterium]